MYWEFLENINCLDASSIIRQKLLIIIETVKLAGPSELFHGFSLFLLAKFGHLMLPFLPRSALSLLSPIKKPRKPNRGFPFAKHRK